MECDILVSIGPLSMLIFIISSKDIWCIVCICCFKLPLKILLQIQALGLSKSELWVIGLSWIPGENESPFPSLKQS